MGMFPLWVRIRDYLEEKKWTNNFLFLLYCCLPHIQTKVNQDPMFRIFFALLTNFWLFAQDDRTVTKCSSWWIVIAVSENLYLEQITWKGFQMKLYFKNKCLLTINNNRFFFMIFKRKSQTALHEPIKPLLAGNNSPVMAGKKHSPKNTELCILDTVDSLNNLHFKDSGFSFSHGFGLEARRVMDDVLQNVPSTLCNVHIIYFTSPSPHALQPLLNLSQSLTSSRNMKNVQDKTKLLVYQVMGEDSTSYCQATAPITMSEAALSWKLQPAQYYCKDCQPHKISVCSNIVWHGKKSSW